MDNTNLTLDLSSLSKQRILIDGDENRALYLNLSDMSIVVRFKEKYDELLKLNSEAIARLSVKSKDDIESVLNMADALKDIDAKMRELIDYIFDGNVSETCAPFGSMFDLVDGKIRYEIIIDALSNLYGDTLKAETKKFEKRVSENKHTKKYVKH